MPTMPFCALDQAYGDWDSDKKSPPHQQQQQPQHVVDTPKKNIDFDYGNDIRSFCPNCQNCLNKNDALQQKVIDQTVWPRPRWIPQVPQSYTPMDPYNRYWANVAPFSGREDFGNVGTYRPSNNIDLLLKITIFIVGILFIILLVDLLHKNKLAKE